MPENLLPAANSQEQTGSVSIIRMAILPLSGVLVTILLLMAATATASASEVNFVAN